MSHNQISYKIVLNKITSMSDRVNYYLMVQCKQIYNIKKKFPLFIIATFDM